MFRVHMFSLFAHLIIQDFILENVAHTHTQKMHNTSVFTCTRFLGFVDFFMSHESAQDIFM